MRWQARRRGHARCVRKAAWGLPPLATNCAVEGRYKPLTSRILRRFGREAFRNPVRSGLRAEQASLSKQIVEPEPPASPNLPSLRDDVFRGRLGVHDAGACGVRRCCCLPVSCPARILQRELLMKRIFRPLPLPAFLRALPAPQRPILVMRSLVRPSEVRQRLRLPPMPSTRPPGSVRPIYRALRPLFSSSRRGGIARSPSCTSGWLRRCARLFPRRRRVRTPPSRRASSRKVRRVSSGRRRCSSRAGCVLVFAANSP